VALSCAARRPPVLRAVPRGSDTGSREGEPFHLEVPRVQGTADDGDGVAHGGAGMEHTCIAAISRRCYSVGAHGAAQ
jgi:hypothetical protein